MSETALTHAQLDYLLDVLSDRFDDLMDQSEKAIAGAAYQTSMLRTFRAAGVLDAMNVLRGYQRKRTDG